MKTRAITGLFFIIVMLASVLTGPYTFAAFYTLLALLCLNEFYTLIRGAGVSPSKLLGLLCGLSMFTGVVLHYQFKIDYLMPPIIIVVAVVLFAAELFNKSHTSFTHIAYTVTGLILTVVPFCFFYALGYVQQHGFNHHFPMVFLFLLWSNDTGAYVVGITIGRHKLFERHSPKKTWEGFIGGGLFTIFIAYIISRYLTDVSFASWAIMAALISVFGTLGDLLESMLKRSLDTKDSGSILPGHGGLLDRFDGLLLAAPMIFAFLYFVCNLAPGIINP